MSNVVLWKHDVWQGKSYGKMRIEWFWTAYKKRNKQDSERERCETNKEQRKQSEQQQSISSGQSTWYIFKLSACSMRQINEQFKKTTKLSTHNDLYVFISMLRSFHSLNLYWICISVKSCILTCLCSWMNHTNMRILA